MKQTKSNSYNSTPFSSKENVCPNAKFLTLRDHKKHLTPSIGTDPEFSIFNTINVPNTHSLTTKSRADLQAIVEDFTSPQHHSLNRQTPHQQSRHQQSREGHSDKSFLALLGIAMGKELSVEEAISKCEEYEISNREQLLSIIDSKEPTREWPLPLSSLLLTDLGHLKIATLCERLDNHQDLSDQHIEILDFLLPKAACFEAIDRALVLDHYHDFRNKIDEKFSLVDGLVKEYTLRIQPKLRCHDKMVLIKVEKRLRKLEKIHQERINFGEMRSCLEGLGLLEEECLVLFKYLFFLENDSVMPLVDRRQTVLLDTCIREVLDKTDLPLAKPTVSRIQLIGDENAQVINDLLHDKTHLLGLLEDKDQQILKLTNSLTLLTLKLENQAQQAENEKRREVENTRAKFGERIKELEMEAVQKNNLIEWYRNELEAAVAANQAEVVASQRSHIYRHAHHQARTARVD